MAYDYTFGPGPALDPNLDLVPAASGEVFGQAEGGDPLTVLVNGVSTSTIESDANGLLQAFAAEQARVWVDLGTGRFRLTSFDGAIEQVEAARDAAVAAQGAAEDARDAAEQAAGGGGVGSGILTLPVGSDTSSLAEGTVFGFYTPPEPGTSVSLVGYKTNTASTATASIVLDPATPSGGDAIGIGDAMIAVVATNSGPASPQVTAPAGWTQIRSDWAVKIGTMCVSLFVKIRQAGDTSYQFTISDDYGLNAALMWVRGATATLSEWVIGDPKARTDSPAEDVTCTAPSVSITQAPMRVLALSFERTGANESSVDWSWGSGEEWFFALADDSPAITTIAVASKVVSSAGASGDAVCTYPNPQATNGWAFQLGIPAGN